MIFAEPWSLDDRSDCAKPRLQGEAAHRGLGAAPMARRSHLGQSIRRCAAWRSL